MGYSDEKDEHAGAGASSSTSTSAAASSSTSSSPDAPPTYLGERQPLNHPSDDAGVGYKETQPLAAQTTIVMHNGEPVIHQYPVVAAAPPLYSSHYLPSHQQGFLPYHQSPPHDAQAQESLDSAACTRFHSVAKSLWLNFWWCTLGGGLLCFMFYVALGILLCVTIIFIPLGFRVLKLSVSLLAPFEHTNVRTTDKKSGKVICLTLLWVPWALILYLLHLSFALLYLLSIFLIPFGLMHLKIAMSLLWPFDRSALPYAPAKSVWSVSYYWGDVHNSIVLAQPKVPSPEQNV